MKRSVVAASVALSVFGVVGPSVAPSSAMTEDQAARAQEWWLSGLGITAAQKVANGGAGVTVCLIDSGVNPQHPDLVGASFSGGTDLSGRGSPDGLTPLRMSDIPGHGTAMAALIVGQGHGANHADGILGVAPKATVMSVSEGGGEANAGGETAPAIRYCVDHGAKVINLSIGRPSDIRAVAYAQQHDVVIVNAAGNNEFAGDCDGLFEGGYGLLTVSGVANGLVHDPITCTNQDRNQYTQGGGDDCCGE